MIVPLTPLDFRRRAAHLYSAKVGIVDGNQRFTYSQFDERSRRLAGGLLTLGLKEGDVVSFLSYNCHQLLEAYYGVIQMGGVLNPINIRMNATEIAYVLKHAESKVVFYHSDFRPLFEALNQQSPAVQHWIEIEPGRRSADSSLAYEDLLSRSTPSNTVGLQHENQAAELFYTSGTTSGPKGVILSHRSLYLHAIHSLTACQLRDDDTLLHVVPLFHVNGWGTPHTLTAVGGKHVILRKIVPSDIIRLVQQERVTQIFAVPAVFLTLLAAPERNQFDLSSLRQLIIGGAPSSLSLIERLEEEFRCRAISGYGLTETSPVISLAMPKDHMKDWDAARRRQFQFRTGTELIGTHIRVVNEEGHDVARDDQEVGEIIVRSNVVMTGYYKDKEESEKTLRDGWFYTGDLATIDAEGCLRIVDRSKDIIISGGENVSSAEVENALYSHSAVFECAVIGVPDEQWGEVPIAIVLLKPGEQITETELIEHTRNRLAHFKCPKSIHFRDSLPKGGTGKILKRELREPFWEGKERRVN